MEIGRIHKHVGRKTADGAPSAENRWKIGENPPQIAVLSCRVKDSKRSSGGKGPYPRRDDKFISIFERMPGHFPA